MSFVKVSDAVKAVFAFGALLTALAAYPAAGLCQDRPPAKVVLSAVSEKDVARTLPVVGTIDFDRMSRVAPEVPGKLVEHFMKEGAYVKKGDVLASIDTELLEKDIEALQSRIEETDVKLQNAKGDSGRSRDLYDKGIISLQKYEDDATAYDELARQKETLEKNLEKQELTLEKSITRAPYNGMILEKYKDVGEWIKPDEPVCMMASTDDVFVSVSVLEDAVSFISVGDEVAVDLTALGRELTGSVMGIVPVAEPRSRNFVIKVKIPFNRFLIRNMSAVVHVPVSPPMKLRLISRDALVRFQGKDLVYTVKEGKAAALPVNIVAYLGGYVGVDNPYIVPGMQVVVEGNERLMPDAPVEVVKGNRWTP